MTLICRGPSSGTEEPETLGDCVEQAHGQLWTVTRETHFTPEPVHLWVSWMWSVVFTPIYSTARSPTPTPKGLWEFSGDQVPRHPVHTK